MESAFCEADLISTFRQLFYCFLQENLRNYPIQISNEYSFLYVSSNGILHALF
jgi:hypothetical protein